MPRFQRRAPLSEQVDSEVAFHLDMLARELVERGLDPAAARAEAARRFGDVTAVRGECVEIGGAHARERGRAERLAELRQDARYAVRQLLRAPLFAAVAVLTLALGIGATTAIFSAVRSVVLRPLALAHPERVVIVAETTERGNADLSAGNLTDVAALTRSFEHLAAERFQSLALSDEDGAGVERVAAGRVTHDFFEVFGVRPLLGRDILPEEDSPGHERVTVLSYALWAGRFGADPRVVGRQVRLAGVVHTVVGVMPERFDPTLSGEQLWVPLALTPEQRAEHDNHNLLAVGLLKEGVARERASADVDAAMRELARRFPKDDAGRGGAAVALREELVGNYRRRLFVTLGAVTLVLLIACGNVANLLLARGGARARELALRASLGAGRGRIARQLLTESLVLGLTAAVAGVGLAYAGVRALVAAAPPGIPRLAETRIDGAVLLFALGAAVASALLFGLAPAVRAARQDVQGALRAGGRGLGHGRDRMRGGLVTAEVALAFTLLAGAGALVRSAVNLQRVPPGFDPAGVVIGRVSLPAAKYETREAVLRTFEAMHERLRATPGVRRAALMTQPPLGPGRSLNGLIPEGRPIDARSTIQSRLHLVTPGYFAAMGVRLVRGRDFGEDDRAGRERVVIVSEAFARAAWPGQDPLGKRLVCCEGGPENPMWKTVVGIAGDVRSDGPAAAASPEFYLPIAQAPADAWDWVQRAVTLVARGDAAAGDDAGAALVSAMRAAVRDVDPGVPLYGVTTMRDALRGAMAEARFNTLLLTLLAAIGLVLSAVGVYGVAAYFVALRAHELGVRLALGATPRAVLRLMLWQGLRPAALGVVVGGVAAVGALRVLRGAVFGVSPTDPLSVVVAAAVLLAAAAVATAVPAWRAARADATRALASA